MDGKPKTEWKRKDALSKSDGGEKEKEHLVPGKKASSTNASPLSKPKSAPVWRVTTPAPGPTKPAPAAAGQQHPKHRAGEKKQWRPDPNGTIKKIITKKVYAKKDQDFKAAFEDLQAAAAGARDAANELDKQRKEESEESAPAGAAVPDDKSEPDLDTERQEMDYAEYVIRTTGKRVISFKEHVAPKYDAVRYFLFILTFIEFISFVLEALGADVMTMLIRRKVVKMLITAVGVSLAAYVDYGWQVVTTATALMTIVSASYSIWDDHSLYALILPTLVALVYWFIIFCFAARGYYLYPFFGQVRYNYKVKRMMPMKEDASVRADAQSLTEGKHSRPLYTNVRFFREYRLFGKYFGFAFPFAEAGRRKAIHISFELALQLMVPRCTGIEYSDEMIGNSISAMTKATHGVNIDRMGAAFGTFEHTKLFAYALVKSMHEKVKTLPFPRTPVTHAQ